MRFHLHSNKTGYDRWVTVEEELTVMVGQDGGALISLPDAYCNERLLSPLETERAIEELEAPEFPHYNVITRKGGSTMKEQLAVRVKEDGTWLEFTASNGQSALIRVESLAEGKGSITAGALKQWCRDRQADVRS